MKYNEASSFSRIARTCWKGFYVDTARNKIVYHHADSPKIKEITFVPTLVELSAEDWELITNVPE